MTHNIHISHDQCVLIARLLRAAIETAAPMTSDELEETDLLATMFANLPAENDVSTMTYGFCL